MSIVAKERFEPEVMVEPNQDYFAKNCQLGSLGVKQASGTSRTGKIDSAGARGIEESSNGGMDAPEFDALFLQLLAR